MKARIRKARPEEATVLTELSMLSKQSNGYDDAFMEACRQELTIKAEDFSKAEYWVAEDRNICGLVALTADAARKRGEVSAFFVEPTRKRQGIGRLLWETLLESARAKGLKALHLDADPAAVPFYNEMGFEIIGYVASASIKGRSLPRMKLVL